MTGKKLKTAKEKIESRKLYQIDEAIDLAKSLSFTKFDESLDVALRLGIDTKHSDQMVRGIVKMPAGTGKTVKVAVICKDERVEEAKKAGADIVGNNDLIEEIKSGKINFDLCIASPDMMGSVGQIARILGPKGLMPNPKLGTVTNEIGLAIKNAKTGQIEFRAEKGGIIHAGVGKISFDKQGLISNVSALVSAVTKAKPPTSKGTYLKGIHISSTMGPSLAIDISSVKTGA